MGRTRFLPTAPWAAAACRRAGNADQPEEVVAFGLVELQSVHEPVQDTVAGNHPLTT